MDGAGQNPAELDRSFGKTRHLRLNADFQAVYKRGHRVSAPSLTLVWMRQEDPGPARLGLSVSRKAGKAHVRNLLKRRLREIFRLEAGLLAPGHDLVLVAKPGPPLPSYQALQTEVLSLFKRAGFSQARQ
jgi:ribonuclease P protein component